MPKTSINEQLLQAVANQQYHTAQTLLKQDASLFARDSNGLNVFHLAIEHDDAKIVCLLVATLNARYRLRMDVIYSRPLTDAHMGEYVEVRRHFSESLKARIGLSPLAFAMLNNQLNCVRALLHCSFTDLKGCEDTNWFKYPREVTPLMYAVIDNNNPLFTILFDHVHACCLKKEPADYLDELTDYVDLPEFDFEYCVYYGEEVFPLGSTLLHYAASLGCFDIVRFLLAVLPEEIINRQNDKYEGEGGKTALQYALEYNDEEVVISFLASDKVVDKNPKVDPVDSLLHHACTEGWLEVLKLLATCQGINFSQPNRLGQTPILLASENEQYKVLDCLRELCVKYDYVKIDFSLKVNIKDSKHNYREAEKIREFVNDLPELQTALFGHPDASYDHNDSDVIEYFHDMMPEEAGFDTDSDNGSTDSDDDIPAVHARAYKKDNPLVAKLLLSFPGAGAHDPLPDLRDPSRYVQSLEMQQLVDTDRQRRFTETTTIGASSAPSIEGLRTIQTQSLLTAEPGFDLDDKDDLQQQLDEVNRKLEANEELLGEDSPFLIPHFRGINFNRAFFPSSESKEAFALQAQHAGIHSRSSYQAAGIHFTKHSDRVEEQLTKYDQVIKGIWNESLNDKIEVKKNSRTFSKAKYYVQHRFTNTPNKTYEGAQHRDMWPEIWNELRSLAPSLREKKIILADLPLVAMGKTPEHAVRYAVGRSLAGATRNKRGDPYYRNTGKAKHRLIGLVYITLHTIQEYRQAHPSDVLKLHAQQKISVFPHYIHETEVSFPGGVSQKNVCAVIPICFPSFAEPWDKLDDAAKKHYQLWYGLDATRYKNYQERFKNTARPESFEVYNQNFFKRAWQTDFKERYGLTRDIYDLFKCIYAALDQTFSDKTAKDDFLNKVLLFNKALKHVVETSIRIKFDKFNKIKNPRCIEEQLNHRLKQIHPYRRLKNELRDYFATYTAGKKTRSGHVSKLILEQAHLHAQAQGKHLIYRRPDGHYTLYDHNSIAVRSESVRMAQAKPKAASGTSAPKRKATDDTATAKRPALTNSLRSGPIFFRPKEKQHERIAVQQDTHWYTDTEMSSLLDHFFAAQDDVEIVTAIDARFLNGTTIRANLAERMNQIKQRKQFDYTCNHIILAVNIGQQHWVALYINRIDEDNPLVYYIDPLGSAMINEVRSAISDVFPNLSPTRMIISPIRLQHDSYNCGPWVIESLKALVATCKLPVGLDITQARASHQTLVSSSQSHFKR